MENNKPKGNRFELILMFLAFLLYMSSVVLMTLRLFGIIQIALGIGVIPLLIGNVIFTVGFWKKIPKYNIALLVATLLILIVYVVRLVLG